MKSSFDLSIEVSQKYDFNKNSIKEIELNPWVNNQWPLVYFIQNDNKKLAYVGESTNFSNRLKNHLSNPKKSIFNQISIIGSDKFNKSATLDIESKLIQYISSEGTYKLQNGNYGLINHNYYQQDLYKNLFKEIWNKLIDKKIVSKSIVEIENSELFKYSPYKSLNEDQYNSVISIIQNLNNQNYNKIIINGSAGTGKTILATYLIKLLTTDVSNIEPTELNDNEIIEINLIQEFKKKYPKAKIGIVIAMTSLRKTLQNVFRKTPDLKSSMVLSPSDTFKKKYDLLIVDEAHRLRQYKNIGWRGAFKKNNRKLGLDDTGTELDWILANSKNQIFFYDEAQSVKPSDIDSSNFDKLLNDEKTVNISLKSQMRVKGGIDYIKFIDQLLSINFKTTEFYDSDTYEFKIFDSFRDLHNLLTERENTHGLSRLVSGYSWPWKSDPKRKNNPTPDATDIEIEGLEFQWNKTAEDWINSENSFNEIGCIHTVQGYDLNYVGVIFGNEIRLNPKTNQIEIDPNEYYDNYGKLGVKDKNDLKSYIINIYKTIMYRGIKGTFVYICDDNLREYFKKHVPSVEQDSKLRILPWDEVKPYVNSVPYYDIKIAAGNFSELQLNSDFDWIELPMNISAKKDYFVCPVIGDSMNKKIPSGSLCLFKKNIEGSRNGKIVLVQHSKIQDAEFGAGFTIKLYESEKIIDDDGWKHSSIILKPMSTDKSYQNIVLEDDDTVDLEVIGEFITVLN